MEALAKRAAMSPSALHRCFKEVTALSPLQYQKRLRLQEARRLMLGEELDAAEASFRVGYESRHSSVASIVGCSGRPLIATFRPFDKVIRPSRRNRCPKWRASDARAA